jgi:HTH-type transcriptional regulator/antitoxin HigA
LQAVQGIQENEGTTKRKTQGMKTRAKAAKKDRYLELIQRFPLRPLRSDAELNEAIATVNILLDQLDYRPWNKDEKDYVDVLADLIEKYESEHVKIEPLSGVEMLKFLIENKRVTQAQVAKDCRIAESTISEILAGSRKMNRNHIAKFAAYFHVGPGVFFDD